MESTPNPSNIRPLASSQSEQFFHSKRFSEATQKLNPVLLWAAIAGLLTGLIGGSFRLLVSVTLNHRVHWIHSLHSTPMVRVIVSIVLSGVMVYFGFWLMRQFAPDTAGSGIPQIEGLLEGYFPLVWQRVLPVKFISGVSLLGAGMVLGREGPTIQMGGSIGKMVAGWFQASQEQTRILVAASAGAGLATAFNAPLAGILFVFEEMRPTFRNSVSAYRAVTLACMSDSCLVSYSLTTPRGASYCRNGSTRRSNRAGTLNCDFTGPRNDRQLPADSANSSQLFNGNHDCSWIRR